MPGVWKEWLYCFIYHCSFQKYFSGLNVLPIWTEATQIVSKKHMDPGEFTFSGSLLFKAHSSMASYISLLCLIWERPKNRGKVSLLKEKLSNVDISVHFWPWINRHLSWACLILRQQIHFRRYCQSMRKKWWWICCQSQQHEEIWQHRVQPGCTWLENYKLEKQSL